MITDSPFIMSFYGKNVNMIYIFLLKLGFCLDLVSLEPRTKNLYVKAQFLACIEDIGAIKKISSSEDSNLSDFTFQRKHPLF